MAQGTTTIDAGELHELLDDTHFTQRLSPAERTVLLTRGYTALVRSLSGRAHKAMTEATAVPWLLRHERALMAADGHDRQCGR